MKTCYNNVDVCLLFSWLKNEKNLALITAILIDVEVFYRCLSAQIYDNEHTTF